MHVVNVPLILPKHKAKKSRYQKKGIINYRKKEDDLAFNTYTCHANSTPTLHSYPDQISSLTLHTKSQTLSPSTPVRPPFRKAPVTSTTSWSSIWRGWGWFMLSQSLLVGLSRIASLTRYRWGARYPTYEQVLGLFLVGYRELDTIKQLLTIGCLNTWL